MCEKTSVPAVGVRIYTKQVRLPHKSDIVADATVYTGVYSTETKVGFHTKTAVLFEEVTLEQLELLQKLQLEWAKASHEMPRSS